MSTPVDFDSLWDYHKPAESEARFRSLLDSLDGNALPSYRIELMTQIARAKGAQQKFHEAQRVLDECERLLTPGLLGARVRCLMERGRVFNAMGDVPTATSFLVRAWEAGNAAYEDSLAIETAQLLATLAEGSDRISWNQKALQLAESSADPKARRWRGTLYNNLGWTYSTRGEYEAALENFERALTFREIQGNRDAIHMAKWCVARTLRTLGRVEEALAMLQTQLEELEEQKRTIPVVIEEIGECLHLLGREEEARPYFVQAFELLSRDNTLPLKEPDRLARLKGLGYIRQPAV